MRRILTAAAASLALAWGGWAWGAGVVAGLGWSISVSPPRSSDEVRLELSGRLLTREQVRKVVVHREERELTPGQATELETAGGRGLAAIAKGRSDWGCDGSVLWTVEVGQQRRIFCRDSKSTAQLKDLMTAAESLFKDGSSHSGDLPHH